MNLMDNAELYPEGWRHRKFFGSRKAKDNTKQPRLEENIVDEIMRKMETEVSETESRHTEERKELDPSNVSASPTWVPNAV